jgi:D-alanyl-D-alanine endopeptidase (penicillin-binding protein 7)
MRSQPGWCPAAQLLQFVLECFDAPVFFFQRGGNFVRFPSYQVAEGDRSHSSWRPALAIAYVRTLPAAMIPGASYQGWVGPMGICCRARYALAIALSTFLLGSAVALPARPGQASRPDVRSSAALVIDAADSSVLFAQRDNVAVPVASITKLMTALVVLDGRQSLDELLTITREDTQSAAGSRLATGTRLTRGELLHLALMSSENRAAHALGRSYPGGLDAFQRAMNAKATALGMSSSHFVEPTGLSSRNVASARDLVKLVNAAASEPIIRQYSTDQHYTVKAGRRSLEFRNTNTLVARPDWDIAVQKTGYTLAAGQCLVMNTIIEGRSVNIVLLNSYGKYTRVADARRIRKWMEAARK